MTLLWVPLVLALILPTLGNVVPNGGNHGNGSPGINLFANVGSKEIFSSGDCQETFPGISHLKLSSISSREIWEVATETAVRMTEKTLTESNCRHRTAVEMLLGSIEGIIRLETTAGYPDSLYHTVQHWVLHLETTDAAKHPHQKGIQTITENPKVFLERVVDDWIYLPIQKVIREQYSESGLLQKATLFAEQLDHRTVSVTSTPAQSVCDVVREILTTADDTLLTNQSPSCLPETELMNRLKTMARVVKERLETSLKELPGHLQEEFGLSREQQTSLVERITEHFRSSSITAFLPDQERLEKKHVEYTIKRNLRYSIKGSTITFGVVKLTSDKACSLFKSSSHGDVDMPLQNVDDGALHDIMDEGWVAVWEAFLPENKTCADRTVSRACLGFLSYFKTLVVKYSQQSGEALRRVEKLTETALTEKTSREPASEVALILWRNIQLIYVRHIKQSMGLITERGHLNVDTSNLHMVAISKSYFRNRVNMGRPVGRFARYAMEEVIRAMDVPTISDCETPGLSMQESSEIYKGAIERITGTTPTELRSMSASSTRSDIIENIPDSVLEKILDLSQDAISEVIQGMRALSEALGGSVQDVVKIASDLSGYAFVNWRNEIRSESRRSSHPTDKQSSRKTEEMVEDLLEGAMAALQKAGVIKSETVEIMDSVIDYLAGPDSTYVGPITCRIVGDN